ncbi:hypothetical protein [Saccharothrix variisporea]|uniref:Ig-like domain-containing protein n=1 Tax=Saccharothrix variisporea TaxID=543527 RepID=A0A495XQL7_9PSEU|nr:hypothetical protein [Saccharothrix variisporea]RKT74733.1 hypothetical protein DFJ66_8102 [Saccharothrix variisporea]
MPHVRTALTIVALNLVVVGLVAPATAHAAVDQQCVLSEVVTYDPPLTDTPQTVTFRVSGQLFNCTGSSASTGSYAESGTVTGATCTGTLSPGSGTRVFTWTNSAIAPSTFSYNRTATRVGGNIQVVAVGSITAGTFTPDPAKSVGLGAHPDPTACATAGVSRLTAAGSLTIGL